MEYFSIGEIFRLGLLKNFDGEPYKHKSTVSKIVNKMTTKTVKTRWGIAKTLSEKQIQEYNDRNCPD